MLQVLDQLERRPARRQAAAPQLAHGQLNELGNQPGAEILEISQEHRAPRARRIRWRGEGDSCGEVISRHKQNPVAWLAMAATVFSAEGQPPLTASRWGIGSCLPFVSVMSLRSSGTGSSARPR